MGPRPGVLGRGLRRGAGSPASPEPWLSSGKQAVVPKWSLEANACERPGVRRLRGLAGIVILDGI